MTVTLWNVISGTVSKGNLSFNLKGCSLSRKQVTCLVRGWNKPIQLYRCDQSESMVHSMLILCLIEGVRSMRLRSGGSSADKLKVFVPISFLVFEFPMLKPCQDCLQCCLSVCDQKCCC